MTEKTKPLSRRKARKRAFEVLFGLNFEPPGDLTRLSQAFDHCPDPPAAGDEPYQIPDPVGVEEPEDEDFARELVFGAWNNREELDALVVRFSRNWKINRIAKVELTILRLALFEMLHRQDIPLRVALNEAVELAKRYGDDNSANFINGILDAAAKAAAGGEFGPGKEL